MSFFKEKEKAASQYELGKATEARKIFSRNGIVFPKLVSYPWLENQLKTTFSYNR